MKQKYIAIILIIIAFFNSDAVISQCSVFAPPDVSVPCGGTTSFTASTSSVTYSVITSACSPVAISGATAFATNCDDCVTGQIPIGFPFNFYGNTYNNTVISSNGLLGFGPFTYTGYTPFTIPAAGNPNNYIAGFMADIDIRYGGTITYATVGTAPNREFVVSYNNVVPYNAGTSAGTGSVSFQIILQENGGFRVVVSQLSANWSASTSGALATSGAENNDGTYAFPVPGRNNTDWPGITTGALDCTVFNPVPCVFQRWQIGATIVSTNPNLTVTPPSATTYTAYWDCGGNICSDDIIVSIASVAQTITQAGVTNNVNCSSTNGAVQLAMTAIPNGTYILNYLNNGVAQTQSITISGSPTNITIPNLNSGNYTNFSINTGGCGAPFLAGPITITDSSIAQSTVTNNSNCLSPNGSILFNTSNLTGGTYTLNFEFNGTPTSQSVTLGGGSTVAQNTTFNTGALAATDPTYARSFPGTGPGCTLSGFATNCYYDVYAFTVSTNGSYTFNMCTPGTNFDGFGSLYQNAFNPASACGVPANFVYADDDSNTALGNCDNDARLIATLTTGITYYIVTSSFDNTITGNYEWTFTGPAGANIIIGNPTFTLGNLAGGDYTNLQLNGPCGNIIPGPIKIINTSAKTWDGSSDTDWDRNQNWSGNNRPTDSDCVIIPNVINDPIISGAAYQALAGTLTVENGGSLTVNGDTFLRVTNNVTVNLGGTLNFLNNATLLQTNNVANSGNVNYNRTASAIRGSDYVYWSSPVLNQNLNTLYSTPISGPKYQWNTTAVNANSGLGAWDVASGNMLPAKGYIMRGSSNYSMAATNLDAIFTGTPNNGNLTIKSTRGNMTVTTVPSVYTNVALNVLDDNWSLLGNPYPSAINALQFLATNSTNLLGNVRLWRHLNTPLAIPSPFYQNFVYSYNSGDYLTINFTGPTVPNTPLIIKAGQAFMIQRIEGPQDLTGTDVNFNNSMRLTPTNTVMDNSGFYRAANQNQNTTSVLEKHRIWLDIVDGTTNASETTLIGYLNGATANFDSDYDATIGITTAIGIYSFADNQKCIIQGKPTPFNQNDLVPLGINVHNNGNFHIAIKAVDGLFSGATQNIYLEDKLLNVLHDLKANPYSFTAVAGTHNDRFVLRYATQALATTDFVKTNDIKIFTNNKININSPLQSITEIKVFDILGKLLYTKVNIKSNDVILNEFNKTNSVLIVKVTLENKQEIIKKVIF